MAALGVMLGACRHEVSMLRAERRAALPVAPATLAVADSGEAWLGVPGALVRVDSLGRTVRRTELPAESPRVLGRSAGRLVVADGDRVLLALDGDSVVARRRAPRVEPVAADPGGRWVYTTHAWGSVLGLDSALVPRWGWPDGGARATALAAGGLGDRVYVALAEGRDQAPQLQVRDAWTGRQVAGSRLTQALRGLVATADPLRLYGWDEGGVVALQHAGPGVVPAWRVGVRRLGMDSVAAVRPSPDGRRVAVLGRRGGRGRLVVLSAATGRDTARWNGSPPDAAWDVRGRLLVAEGRELIWLR